MVATILYLNTESAHIPQMTLAGMRRYASSRGWTVEAYPVAESRKNRLAALFRKHAPVVGCVWECSDDGLPGSPSALDAVPVVYLHVSRGVPENGVMFRADNDAVAVAAFRELSLGRPAAYAVVGVPEAFEWSFVRVKRFCEEVRKAKRHCAAFPWIEGETSSARSGRLTSWVAAPLPLPFRHVHARLAQEKRLTDSCLVTALHETKWYDTIWYQILQFLAKILAISGLFLGSIPRKEFPGVSPLIPNPALAVPLPAPALVTPAEFSRFAPCRALWHDGGVHARLAP